ncbi:MAG: ComEC/Rec2 family competence protein [Vicinamibacterales bacterium]|nr:ComEC/Rec2 family competence protein [Vicinamibacterales bacterium]
MTHPTSVAALPVLVGVALGSAVPEWDAGITAAAGVVLASAWAGLAHGARRGSIVAATVALAVGYGAFGAWVGSRETRRALEPSLKSRYVDLVERGRDADPVTVEGTLRRDAVATTYGATLTLAVERIGRRDDLAPASGGLRVAVGGDRVGARLGAWRAGRRVRMPVAVRRPARYLNPGVADQERRSARLGQALRGSVKSALLVDVIEVGVRPAEWAAVARAWVRRALARDVGRWSARSSGVATAILIGDRGGLDDATQRRLRNAGTYHVIAISGGNIAILGALVLAALRLGRCGARSASLVTVVVLGAYAYLVGPEASVVRATLGATVLLLARAADHRTPPLNAIALVAATMLVATPLTIFDVGFVLTFGATGAILVGVPRCVGWWRTRLGPRWDRPWLIALVSLGAATLCAELALFPVSASAFSRVTGAGLLLNFAAVPLMTVVQCTGMAVLGASAVWPAWPVLSWLAGLLAHAAATGLVDSAALVEWLPWLSRRVAPPSLAIVAPYYAGWVAVLAGGRRYGLRRLGAVVSLTTGLLIVTGAQWSWPTGWASPGRLRVTFLDVGQGDATLAEFPNGATLLVDAGGIPGSAFDVGARVVAPAVWARGIRRLDFLALSHGHPDHIGGAVSVVADLGPREIWEGVPVPSHTGLEAVAAAAAARGSAWRTLQAGDHLRLGGVDVHVWHPLRPDWERPRVRNDDSVVLELRWGEVSILLPGDIGGDAEQPLATRFVPAPVQVVKVPHHGSRRNS